MKTEIVPMFLGFALCAIAGGLGFHFGGFGGIGCVVIAEIGIFLALS